MRAIVGLGILVLLGACSAATMVLEDGAYDPSKIVYEQDPRTKLCFGAMGYERTDSAGRYSSGISHAHVPCTDEVLALVHRKRR